MNENKNINNAPEKTPEHPDQIENQKSKWLLPVSIVVVLLLVVFGLSSWQKQNYSAKGPIRVGFVGPLTGGPSLWGVGAKNMTDLAVEDINSKGGIKGRQLEVSYEDGKCTPQEATTVTQKLTNDGIMFILGGQCSPETAAMVPLSKDNKFFMLAGVTSSDDAVAGSDSAFRTSPPTIDFTEKLAPITIEKYTNVATITEQAAFSSSYTKDFITSFNKLGGVITDSEEYKPDQTDFKTELLKIKATQPEALFISPQSPTTAINIIKQMKELNINLPILGNSILVTKSVYEQSGKTQNFVDAFSVVPYTDTTKPEAIELSAKYKSRFNSDVPYNYFYVSAAYDATHMLADGLKKCGDEDVECVSNYIRNIDYKGISSDYTFKDNGDSNFDSWATISIGSDGQEVITPL